MSGIKGRSGCGKLLMIVLGVLVGLLIIGSIVGPKDGGNVTTDTAVTSDDANDVVAASPATASREAMSQDSAPAPASEEADANRLTGPQSNAVRSANQYLAMTGFSRDGLISQLSSDAGDGYSVADATAAVDSLDVDWNENAAKSARQYLEMSGFSCSGLIEQLSSDAGDKYTRAQATYGAREAGAC